MRLSTVFLPAVLALTTTARLIALQNPTPPAAIMSDSQTPLQDLSDSPPQTTTSHVLSHILGSQKAINIFASFTRDVASISARLDSASTNTTLLAPLNSALSALPRKPWESPSDYSNLGAQAYSGADGASRADENLKRFVEAHIVPVSPWAEGERVKTLRGEEVWWEMKGEQQVVQPGGLEVQSVVRKAGNGEIWVIKGVVNYKQ